MSRRRIIGGKNVVRLIFRGTPLSLSSFIRVINDKRNQPIGINNNNNRLYTFVESVLA